MIRSHIHFRFPDHLAEGDGRVTPLAEEALGCIQNLLLRVNHPIESND
jgi:hypothetical protein